MAPCNFLWNLYDSSLLFSPMKSISFMRCIFILINVFIMYYLEQYAEYVLNNYLGMHIRTLDSSKKYIFPISLNRCVHKQKKTGVISKIALLFDSGTWNIVILFLDQNVSKCCSISQYESKDQRKSWSQTSVKKSKTIKKALGQNFLNIYIVCTQRISINLEFLLCLKREYGFQITASFTFIVKMFLSCPRDIKSQPLALSWVGGCWGLCVAPQ